MLEISVVAFDLETDLIGQPHPFPEPICLSWADSKGNRGLVATPDIGRKFRELTSEYDLLVTHNGTGFDIPVLWHWILEIRQDLWEALDKSRIGDTLIRERLYDLSTLGKMPENGGRYSLAGMMKRKFGVDRMGSKKGEDSVRTNYSWLKGRPLEEYPKAYIDYAIQDAEDTLRVWQHQESLRQPKGWGSMNTEDRQIKFGLVLGEMTQEGLAIDQEHARKISTREIEQYNSLKDQMVALGYASKAVKSDKVTVKQAKLRKYVETRWPDQHTVTINHSEKTGKTNTSVSLQSGDLLKMDGVLSDPILSVYIKYSELHKNCTTYYPRLVKSPRVFAQYNPLVETGRTSCRLSSFYPSIQIQNQPRKKGVRESFIPDSKELAFMIADIGALELCSAAHMLFGLFGHSRLRELINEGVDPHSYFSTFLLGWTYEEILKLKKAGDDFVGYVRSFSKAPNLGFSGGMGAATMIAYAWSVSGVIISLELSKQVKNLWGVALPEIPEYFKNLTKQFGYIPRDSDKDNHNHYYSVCGRYRNRTTFCQHANGELMQSPGADGMKEAGFELMRDLKDPKNPLYGSQLKWFVHDEFGIQTTRDNLEEKAKAMSSAMIRGLSSILDTVRLTVEVQVADRWRKKGPWLYEGTFSEPPRTHRV